MANATKESPAAKTASAAKKTASSAKKRTTVKDTGAATGFNQLLTRLHNGLPSLGATRSRALKSQKEHGMGYIKAKSRQDEANQRNINAHAKLNPIFGNDQVTMFETTKPISAHLQYAVKLRAGTTLYLNA